MPVFKNIRADQVALLGPGLENNSLSFTGNRYIHPRTDRGVTRTVVVQVLSKSRVPIIYLKDASGKLLGSPQQFIAVRQPESEFSPIIQPRCLPELTKEDAATEDKSFVSVVLTPSNILLKYKLSKEGKLITEEYQQQSSGFVVSAAPKKNDPSDDEAGYADGEEPIYSDDDSHDHFPEDSKSRGRSYGIPSRTQGWSPRSDAYMRGVSSADTSEPEKSDDEEFDADKIMQSIYNRRYGY